MNKVIDTIINRVSCRSYSEKRVSSAKLMQIAEAGKYAPSGMNRQICNILIIKKKSLLEAIREALKEKCGRDCLYGAPHLFIVYGKRDQPLMVQDASCILENMFIAAASLKVNTCWINQLEDLLSDPAYAKLRKKLGLGDEDRVVGSVALGYCKEGTELAVKPRKGDFIKVI